MPVALRMPKLGLTMEEGTLVEWRCVEGAAIERGQIVLLIESEKVEFEVEAPEAGTLRARVVSEGATVPCGAVLAVLTPDADDPLDLEAFLAEHRPAAAPDDGQAEAPAGAAPARARRGRAGPRASPRARKLAEREEIPLDAIAGSGPGGRITEDDVRRVVAELGPRLEVPGGHVGAADLPGPEPAVVLLAGFGLDRTAWNRTLADLEGWRRLFAPDPRGTGRSRIASAGPVEVSQHADDVVAALDASGIARADLVGTSLGAAVAAEIAQRAPGRVRRLVLVSPASGPDPRLAAALDSFVAIAGDPAMRLRVMAPWLFGRVFLSDAPSVERALRGVAAAAARIAPETLRDQAGAFARWLERARATYAGAAAPCLVIAGGDDALIPSAHARAVVEALPDAKLEILETIGHAPMVEAPERLHALLRDFLGH
jgi:pimeloyl-ACP methyl ester carboxylesterase